MNNKLEKSLYSVVTNSDFRDRTELFQKLLQIFQKSLSIIVRKKRFYHFCLIIFKCNIFRSHKYKHNLCWVFYMKQSQKTLLECTIMKYKKILCKTKYNDFVIVIMRRRTFFLGKKKHYFA